MPAMGTLQCLPAMLGTISIDSTIKLVELMRGRGSRPPFCQHFSILQYVLVHWGRGRDLMRFNNINRAARSAFPAPTQNEHIHMRKRTFESPERGPGPHADETCGASDPGPSPQCAKTWCKIEHFATKWGPGPIFTSNMLF